MRYLFIDTETNDLWKDNLDPRDPAQPVMVQAAAVLDDGGRTVAAFSAIVDPRTYVDRVVAVRPEAERVHGITQRIAENYGIPAQMVMNQLFWMLQRADRVVAHNVEFDVNILRSSSARMSLPAPPVPETRCTMMLAASIAAIPMDRTMTGVKPPRLGEAYFALTRKTYAPKHDALYDVYACRGIWRALLERDPSLA